MARPRTARPLPLLRPTRTTRRDVLQRRLRGPRTLAQADAVTAHGWDRADQTTAAAQARRKQYDSPAHRAAREKVKRDVADGVAFCWRCGRWLPPGTKAHVGHSDDRSTILGAECYGCNLATAASKGARIANARRKARAAGQQLPPVTPQQACKYHAGCASPHSRAW